MDILYQTLSPWLGLELEPKDLSFLQISLRGTVVLLATLLIVRLGSRRSLSDRSAFDAVLLVILASVLSRAINGSATFFSTIGAGFVLVFLHRLLAALACALPLFRRLIKGNAEEVIRDGKLVQSALRKHQIAKEDVLEDLRLGAHIDELSKIRVGRIECSGDLSFIKKEG